MTTMTDKIQFLGKAARNHVYTDCFLMDFGKIAWVDMDDFEKIIALSYTNKDRYENIFDSWENTYKLRIVNFCGVLINTKELKSMIEEEFHDKFKTQPTEKHDELVEKFVDTWLSDYYRCHCGSQYRL